MELINFCENIQIFHIHIQADALKMTSCKTMYKIKNKIKCDNQRFYGQNKILFWHSTLSLGAIFAHIGAPQKIQENQIYNPF
jgi:hypothetical protein